MAINNTGAMFKSFEFDGTDSRNFGVYITGAAVYNAPEREVEMISIPNRNGAFALDKGRFENIEVTYPAGIYADTEADFAEGISDLRNFLCSKRGYCRLTDEYNPNEYRMAIYKSGLEVVPALLKAGEFEITFECMPQRYLNSGDEAIEVGEWGETETKTDDIVTIDNTDGLMAVKSLNVSLLPVQDGTPTQDSTIYNEPYLTKTSPSFNSEYDKLVGGTVAWNQLADLTGSTETIRGVTFTKGNDGSYTLTGSNTATGTVQKSLVHYISCVVGHKYYIKSCPAGGTAESSYRTSIWANNANVWKAYEYGNGIILNYGTSYTNNNIALYADVAAGYTITGSLRFVPQVIDLTQMFGSTIADYVYSLEQSTAGSGIAWLRSYGFFTEDYYEYNAGELMSTKPTSHVTSETYPLAGVELRGIPKLDASNNLYYDGDTYESDGTVTRKYGIVDLSSKTWTYQSNWGSWYTDYISDMRGTDTGAETPQFICDKYDTIATNYGLTPQDFNGITSTTRGGSGCRILVKNGSTTIAPTGHLVYELATPTTEEADPYQNPQAVGSTESYTDNRTVPIPVGHESTYANIYPISGYDNTIITDSNGTDTTTTTVTLPHTVYGADVDVTGGESKETWQNIASYNGEAISEPWLSSMDEYVQGTTPTTGAQVTYKLATPTDLQTTPTDVELLTGVNNISSPQGETTIEYGQNPNIIINPTLFDAEPMLEVYGYGTINIGSKTVTLYDQPVGDIVVAEQAKNSFSTTTVEIDDTYANLGDEITFERIFVQTDSRAPNNQYIYTPSITASGTGVTVSADVEVNGRQLLTTITLDSDSSLVFAYGTAKSVSAVANSSFTVHGSTVTSTTTIGLSYDGDKTFTLSRSVTFSQAGYALMMNNTFNLLGPTHLNSTQNLLGNPTYIDLSIGEAYRIDGDSAASLNNAVVLPIELPTLPNGETEITFDNTVTRLDIVPRWWKI